MRGTRDLFLEIIILLTGLSLILLGSVKSVFALMTGDVISSVKISVCGDLIVEGSEDCEGDNLNGQTCESIGYGPGTLSCDIACSFDTYQCSPAPTPTPTPIPTLTPTPTPASDEDEDEEESDEESSSDNESSSTSVSEQQSTSQEGCSLPKELRGFDIDGDCKIASGNLYKTVRMWVDDWKNHQQELVENLQSGKTIKPVASMCNVNSDEVCDLEDLSILLFYVGR